MLTELSIRLKAATGSACGTQRFSFFGPLTKRIASDVETQRLVGLAREADPRARSDFRGGMVVTREPQGTLPAEVDAVQTTIDIERSSETSWPSRQVAQVLNARDFAASRRCRPAVQAP